MAPSRGCEASAPDTTALAFNYVHPGNLRVQPPLESLTAVAADRIRGVLESLS
jgi:hypothetical protein